MEAAAAVDREDANHNSLENRGRFSTAPTGPATANEYFQNQERPRNLVAISVLTTPARGPTSPLCDKDPSLTRAL